MSVSFALLVPGYAQVPDLVSVREKALRRAVSLHPNDQEARKAYVDNQVAAGKELQKAAVQNTGEVPGWLRDALLSHACRQTPDDVHLILLRFRAMHASWAELRRLAPDARKIDGQQTTKRENEQLKAAATQAIMNAPDSAPQALGYQISSEWVASEFARLIESASAKNEPLPDDPATGVMDAAARLSQHQEQAKGDRRYQDIVDWAVEKYPGDPRTAADAIDQNLRAAGIQP